MDSTPGELISTRSIRLLVKGDQEELVPAPPLGKSTMGSTELL